MKKIMERVGLVALISISTIFIFTLMLIVFNALDPSQLNNQVLKFLFAIFALLFVVISALMVWSSFNTQEALRNIMLFSDKQSSTKANMHVVKKIVKENAKRLKGTSIGHIAIFQEENNHFNMKIAVKIVDNEVEVAVDELRSLLVDAFDNILGVNFSSIDFKVTSLQPSYVASVEKAKESALSIAKERQLCNGSQAVVSKDDVSSEDVDSKEIDSDEEVLESETSEEN